MAHSVDGFDLRFTSRTSWKAERRHAGRLIDIVPVTWTKGRRQAGPDIFQEVWFQDCDEMEARRADPNPFVVAVAVAKDYAKKPHEFDEFRGVFEVAATGKLLSKNSLETRVVQRLKA